MSSSKGLPEVPDTRAQSASEVSASQVPSKKVAVKEKPKLRDTASASDAVAAREQSSTAPPAAEPSASGTAAVVSFAVSQWGEVHVDGRMQGVSPPLQELELTPGRHRIEIRNSAAQAHVITLNAKPGERIRIKHKFD